jgi:rod shape-determining protein MreC
VAVIAKLTPDGGIARLVAEPGATNYVSILPVYQPASITTLGAPDSDSLPPSPTAPAAAASAGAAATEE